MAQTTISIRMDDSLKKSFDAICNELGMTMSTAVTILAKKMSREKRLPFDVSIDQHYNSETEAAIYETIHGKNLSEPFDTVEAVREALHAEDQI